MVENYEYYTAPPAKQKNPARRGLVILIGLVLILVIMRFVIDFTSKGQLVVTTGSKTASISVTEITSKTPPKPVHATGTLNRRLSPGEYTVTASDNNRSAQQIVTIKARQKTTANLTIPSLITPEYVSNRTATSLVADANGLSFVDKDISNVYRLNADDSLSLVDSSHSLQSVAWQAPDQGIGSDGSGHFFEINGNSVTSLQLPFPATNNTSVQLTKNGVLYVTDGQSVYQRNTGESYKKIYNIDDQNDRLSVAGATDTEVLLQQVELDTHSNDGDDSSFILLDNGKEVANKNHSSYEVSLAPDGQHIAFSGDATQVFGEDFKQPINIPTGNVNSLTWLDNHTLLYGIASGLWEYDISSKHASQLADYTSIGYVSHITVSQDNKSIYVLVQKINPTQGGNYFLTRVNLDGKRFDNNLLQRLSVYFPYSDGSCSFEFFNFTKLTIVAFGPPESQQDCATRAQNYLKLDGVSGANLQQFYVPDTY